MQNLRESTIRGGLAKVCAQVASVSLRLGSLMVLARLLEPKDFGLVGMVTAVTGALNLFRDFGLSTAAVQRESVSDEEISTLFWVNMLAGLILGIVSLAIAPAVAAFYGEPRLFAVTAVLAATFVLNAVGVQHSTILQRQMRFTTIAAIETFAQFVSTAVGICMAIAGFGYWALVGMTVTLPAVFSLCVWLKMPWIPGRPRRNAQLRSIMGFGGTVTLNSLVVYIGYNLEKVLLGRFWGAEAIGLYGRAYQLANIPTENLNSAAGGVVFAALSRLQSDAGRLKSYFLKGYSLILALTFPATIAGAVLADDVIAVALGPKWTHAGPIFRLLAPAMLVFAVINPLAWLLFSIGRTGRSLKIALVIAPLAAAAYLIGLPYGPKGVALAYSVALTLWVGPHIAWCVYGTAVALKEILLAVSRPLVSCIVAAFPCVAFLIFLGSSMSPIIRLVCGSAVFLSTYVGMLLYVMRQKPLYLELLRGLRRRSSIDDGALVSV